MPAGVAAGASSCSPSAAGAGSAPAQDALGHGLLAAASVVDVPGWSCIAADTLESMATALLPVCTAIIHLDVFPLPLPLADFGQALIYGPFRRGGSHCSMSGADVGMCMGSAGAIGVPADGRTGLAALWRRVRHVCLKAALVIWRLAAIPGMSPEDALWKQTCMPTALDPGRPHLILEMVRRAAIGRGGSTGIPLRAAADQAVPRRPLFPNGVHGACAQAKAWRLTCPGTRLLSRACCARSSAVLVATRAAALARARSDEADRAAERLNGSLLSEVAARPAPPHLASPFVC